MILDFPQMNLSDNEWIDLLKRYLKQWTEIPLTTSEGYDIEELIFFDGFIGTLIRQTEYKLKNNLEINKEFVDSWKYQGKLYRALHAEISFENGSCILKLPEVNYHRMIAHWTTDYSFSKLRNKLCCEEEHKILVAETGDHLAFDVNRFRKRYHCVDPHTEDENEVIFPMYKECIIEYKMTLKEFEEMIQINSDL